LFMRKTIADLDLQNVDIFHGRLESLVIERPNLEPFDGLTSRATMRLSPTLEMAEPLVKKHGLAFLWKGSRRDEELRESGTWAKRWDLGDVLEIGMENTAVARFSKKA
jgi:16S rRNA G527 N7-methylase RsmG